jgi:hypothetical protein
MRDKTSTPSRAESPAAERQRLERLLAEEKALLASPPPLPKWHDNDAMKAWVNTMLGAMVGVRFFEICLVHIPPEVLAESAERRPIEEAERGNIKPLRDVYPHLAPFLHLPKRKRGQRFPKVNNKLMNAVADVSRIRGLWKRHFGRVKRQRDELSAEEIAAERYKLDVEKVQRAVTHRARHRN